MVYLFYFYNINEDLITGQQLATLQASLPKMTAVNHPAAKVYGAADK